MTARRLRRGGLPKRRILATVGALALSVAAVSGCGSNTAGNPSGPTGPNHPMPVALAPQGLPNNLKIGVIASLASEPDQGAQWRDAASGARVAQYRLALGGNRVELSVVDDEGSRGGAQHAVHQLARQHVGGIVLATSGSHTSAAVAAANAAHIPMLAPYGVPGATGSDVWVTGPSASETDRVLARTVTDSGAHRVVLIDVGGGVPAGISPMTVQRLPPYGDASRLATQILKLMHRTWAPDAVVVSGPATRQAVAVSGLQGAKVNLPLFLTSDALSPLFASTLVQDGGSLGTPMTTAGTQGTDISALAEGGQGKAMAAFIEAVNQASQAGTHVKDLFAERPFSAVAGDADTASHDAVLALAVAAARAGSTKPSAIATTLSKLRVGASDGIAGPALNFRHHAAVSQDEVTALDSTTTSPELRQATSTGEHLYWFPAPSGR